MDKRQLEVANDHQLDLDPLSYSHQLRIEEMLLVIVIRLKIKHCVSLRFVKYKGIMYLLTSLFDELTKVLPTFTRISYDFVKICRFQSVKWVPCKHKG